MKKFVFSLETVLRVREKEEEAQRRLLALLEQEEAWLLARVDSLQKEIELFTADFFLVQEFANTILLLQNKAEEKKKESEIARKELVERVKKRKIIEKLKEKQYSRWIVKKQKLEEGRFDEICKRGSF
ncbi:MAG: hypothetical protein ACKVOH_07130 [Chlamydiales bacterium]